MLLLCPRNRPPSIQVTCKRIDIILLWSRLVGQLLLIGFAKPAMLPGTRQIPVREEMIIFSAPRGPGPKISQRALNPQLFPE